MNMSPEQSSRDPDRCAELRATLRARLAERGRITFREFMERALYEPGLGYYTGGRLPWGAEGDYLTAPQVHPALGRATARLAIEADAALGHPDPFTLVEAGGGDGSLMLSLHDALAVVAPGFLDRVRTVSVERSPFLRRVQRRTLGERAAVVRFLSSLDELGRGEVRGGFIANELLDAFPVHRVTRRGGRLRELWVELEGEEFVLRAGSPSTPALARYLARNGVELAEKQVAEICLAVEDWVDSVDRCLTAGFHLVVDYGDETDRLYAPGRRDGTLVCQRRFQVGQDPFRHVGDQDITARVDFGNLRRLGERHGWSARGPCSLDVFLLGFGGTGPMRAMGAGGSARAADAGDGLRERLALRHLLVSGIGLAHQAFLQLVGIDAGAMAFGRERLAGSGPHDTVGMDPSAAAQASTAMRRRLFRACSGLTPT